MRTSEAVTANEAFRKLRKAQSLSASIQKRLAYHRQKNALKLSPGHIIAAQRAIIELSDYSSDIINGEINTSLSSRVMIKRPVAETMAEIFRDLKEPGKAQLNAIDENMVDYMTLVGQQIRSSGYRQSCVYETAYRAKQNRYMIFNTLTVTDDVLASVFNRESTAFKNYIRRVTRETDCSGNSHTYFAVIEAGGRTGRLHIHVLHYLEKLPERAHDPNTGLSKPYRRELDCFREYWPYGHSSPKMVRYNPNDAWGKARYRWPLDTRTGAPLVVKSPCAIAGYLAKYITKSANIKQRSDYLWRVRKSHNLGRPMLDLLSSSIPDHLLEIMTTLQTFPIRLNRQRVPAPLLRKSLLRRLSSTKSNTEFCQMASQYPCRLSPLQSLRVSIRGETTCNPLSATPTSTLEHAEAALSEGLTRLEQRALELNREYFPELQYGYGSTPTDNLAI